MTKRRTSADASEMENVPTKWELAVVLVPHIALLVLMFIVRVLLIPTTGTMVGDFSGELPRSGQWLMDSPYWIESIFLRSCFAVGFILADAKLYVYFYRVKGAKFAHIWAVVVTAVLSGLLCLDLIMTGLFLLWLADWATAIISQAP